MDAAPDQVIPGRLDTMKAIKLLQKASQEDNTAGDNPKKKIDVINGGVEKFHSVTNLLMTQMTRKGMSAVDNLLSSDFKHTAEYCKQLAMEFARIRQAVQQVAALKGLQNRSEFAVEGIHKGAKANLSPQERKTCEEHFQCYGGIFVEGDQPRFNDRECGSATEQAEKYQQHFTELAKAAGIYSNGVAQLSGGLLQVSKCPQFIEDLETPPSKVFKTFKHIPTPAEELLPEMSCVISQRARSNDATKTPAIMSEVQLHQEEPHIKGLLSAINTQVLDGNSESLGQETDVSPFEHIKSGSAVFKARIGKGKDLKSILEDIAPDERESKGILGLLRICSDAAGLEQIPGYEKGTAAQFTPPMLKDYKASDAGQNAHCDAEEALANAAVGPKYEHVKAPLQCAKANLIKSADLKQDYFENLLKNPLPRWSGVDTEQHEIDTHVMKDVREMGREAYLERGVKYENVPHEFKRSATEDTLHQGNREQTSINQEIRNLLRKIEEILRKTPALMVPPSGFFGVRQSSG